MKMPPAATPAWPRSLSRRAGPPSPPHPAWRGRHRPTRLVRRLDDALPGRLIERRRLETLRRLKRGSGDRPAALGGSLSALATAAASASVGPDSVGRRPGRPRSDGQPAAAAGNRALAKRWQTAGTAPRNRRDPSVRARGSRGLRPAPTRARPTSRRRTPPC